MPQKATYQSLINTINEISTIGQQRGLGKLYSQDEFLDGRMITIRGKRLINYGSCSYLGLEMDPRLKEAAIDAVKRYGTYFSCSRTYVSCTNYLELEELLGKIFGNPILLTTNSTLGHQSVMPIVMGHNDVVIYDQQAHISMHEMSYKMRHFGTEIDILRHNRLDELEEKVEKYKGTRDKIWYVIDGVYSMFGDLAPFDSIMPLLDKHRKLHLYVDDAHGMSWAGSSGAGYTHSQTVLHPKMVMGTSMAKGFGSCGGIFVFPTEELRNQVRNWGGPITYSGPQEPATVAAAVASAKIHLSDEIYEFQKSLQDKIEFCNHIMAQYKVPLVSDSRGPIFFVGLGLNKLGYNMVQRVIDSGFYTNIGVFPAVPETCTGMRFTITNHIRHEDIENLARTIAYHLPRAMREENRSMKDIYRAFRKFVDLEKRLGPSDAFVPLPQAEQPQDLKLETYPGIDHLNENEWNVLLGDQGAFDANMLRSLEKTFSGNTQKENNWEFMYYIIRQDQKPVVATFFTAALAKDDMLAPASVSKIVEEERQKNPYYLTSTYLMMGSLLTNGQHLYIDRENPAWRRALTMLIDYLAIEQERVKANAVVLKEFDPADQELRTFFIDHNFVKMDMEVTTFVNNLSNTTFEDYFKTRLNKKKRLAFRNEILKFADNFVGTFNDYQPEELPHFYELYKKIKQTKLNINAFDIPYSFFEHVSDNPAWDIFTLRLKETGQVASVVICGKTVNNYCPLIIGIDYSLDKGYNIYKQSLYHLLLRGIDLKVNRIYFGLTAVDAKYKVGAVKQEQIGFIQMKDHFNHEMIDNMAFASKN